MPDCREGWPGLLSGAWSSRWRWDCRSVRAETPATEPLAEVNGETITRKDLERAVGARLSQLEEPILPTEAPDARRPHRAATAGSGGGEAGDSRSQRYWRRR